MATFKLPEVAAATLEFSRIIRQWLTAEQLALVNAGAADVDDFCDSNQAMINAIEKLAPGYSDWESSESWEDTALIETMWIMAKASKYAI